VETFCDSWQGGKERKRAHSAKVREKLVDSYSLVEGDVFIHSSAILRGKGSQCRWPYLDRLRYKEGGGEDLHPSPKGRALSDFFHERKGETPPGGGDGAFSNTLVSPPRLAPLGGREKKEFVCYLYGRREGGPSWRSAPAFFL